MRVLWRRVHAKSGGRFEGSKRNKRVLVLEQPKDQPDEEIKDHSLLSLNTIITRLLEKACLEIRDALIRIRFVA